jgi:hypothetical protein
MRIPTKAFRGSTEYSNFFHGGATHLEGCFLSEIQYSNRKMVQQSLGRPNLVPILGRKRLEVD